MSRKAGTRQERTLAVAEQIRDVLEAAGVKSALIGALALAAHQYPRYTRDLDLATNTDPFTTLREVAAQLRARGLSAELETPDADDPLGGVLKVTGPDFDRIEVVNFYNPMARGCGLLAREAIDAATPMLQPDSSLPVVSLPHLVAFKLYAGGRKSTNDVLELLERNQPLDLQALRDVCARHGLVSKLDPLLAEVGLS